MALLMIIAVFLVFSLIASNILLHCLPVEHYVCFYLIVFLYEIGMSPGKIVFGVVPSKTIIRVPRKVVYLHYTTVYGACLFVVLVAFPFC